MLSRLPSHFCNSLLSLVKLVHDVVSLAGPCEYQSTHVPPAPARAPAQWVCSPCLCSCRELLEFGEVAELTNLKVSLWSADLLLSFQLNFVLLLQLYSIVTFTSSVSSVVALVAALQMLCASCMQWGRSGGFLADRGGIVPCGSWGTCHAVGRC